MPRLIHAVPKYRKHRASGQAIVTIAGHDHYLGPYSSKASHMLYDRLIAEFLSAGRRPQTALADDSAITVRDRISEKQREELAKWQYGPRTTDSLPSGAALAESIGRGDKVSISGTTKTRTGNSPDRRQGMELKLFQVFLPPLDRKPPSTSPSHSSTQRYRSSLLTQLLG